MSLWGVFFNVVSPTRPWTWQHEPLWTTVLCNATKQDVTQNSSNPPAWPVHPEDFLCLEPEPNVDVCENNTRQRVSSSDT